MSKFQKVISLNTRQVHLKLEIQPWLWMFFQKLFSVAPGWGDEGDARGTKKKKAVVPCAFLLRVRLRKALAFGFQISL